MDVLALIIAVVALVIAIVAFLRSGGMDELRRQIEAISATAEATRGTIAARTEAAREVIAAKTEAARDKTADAVGRLEGLIRPPKDSQ